ncbi:hypothetical protein BDA96_03G225000 [Sorghum bicolor]|uniref:DRBM domain-containing protein n=2 Tax=Sorghum bicolor TaxID=4558 RepID=A0A921UNJ2_SORBI|nr:uncharacterized protein LOC8082190 isoform X2 [Sorghum bicolor]EES03215.2 hypothetical protein SORBI_3003G207000 [Sorghum bicolor]KAG0538314.1 hypothetical protein BDA96_03G225000 [Sorghum bicolor]|eukprot:XP_021311023.1 uncharacterized protein LOC8082190 isoform X2 [Sorghum bicolor]
MEEEGGGGASGSEEVVNLEDAVEQLVEHLVVPVLPRGQVNQEEALSPETQEDVARQVHATVILYNYYHRKQFPQLEFASPDRFCMSACLTVSNKNLLMYVNQAQSRLFNGVGAGLSVTDKAIIDACDIAEALDPMKGSPEMIMWPISKVAVLLLNRTKKVCLLEHGSVTKGVWSLFEKDIKTALGGSLSSDMSVQGSSNNSIALPSEPYVLQQIAYSEVELKTGMKRTNLRFIEEHRVYSLSKKGTATMLFLLHYDQTVDSKLKEMPLDALIERMSGPIFESGLYPTTTSVVECYHLLPYKEVLLNVLNRDWPLGSSLSAPKERVFQNGRSSSLSEIDESLKEQEANSNSKSRMKKITTDISTPKKNKQVVKAIGGSGTNNCSTSKNRKDSNTNCKRKSEAFKTKVATYTEHGGGQSPTKDLQASVQMDSRTEKSRSRNVTQDIILIRDVDPVINDHALKSQKEKDTEKSGGITGNMDVQKYATLQLLWKMRDDTLREHFVLGDRSAEYEMDIQTILTETEMTPKITSILKKYESSWKMMEVSNPISFGEGCQTMNIKRKKLKEAILLRDKCQELNDICRESNWILPRYRVLPSVTGDMYQASVHLTGPDFNLSVDGDMKVTPHEARDSAASSMLSQLQQKARED